MRSRLPLIPAIIWVVVSPWGCATDARFQVSGRVAGQQVATTVDSAVAGYYLERYLDCDRSDRKLVQKIEQALSDTDADPHDRAAYQRLAQRLSTDFAAIHFVARLYQHPGNRRAQDTFNTVFSELAASRVRGDSPPPAAHGSYVLAFVPGYAYRRDPTTGADFANPRALLSRAGFRTLLIETHELGSVERNARLIADRLDRLAERESRIIVVSASKGGPEVAMALGDGIASHTSSRVKAWISVGGLLRGSPYADRYRSWPWRWFAGIVLALQGLPPGVIDDMSTEVRGKVLDRLNIPAHILTLQYVAVPLSGQVTELTRSRYNALRALGPNDGLTLLSDELIDGGIVITDVGLDHFYRDPAIDLKTMAMAYVVIDELQRREAMSAHQRETRKAEQDPGYLSRSHR